MCASALVNLQIWEACRCSQVNCTLQPLHGSMDVSSEHMNVSHEVKLANELPLGLFLVKLEWC